MSHLTNTVNDKPGALPHPAYACCPVHGRFLHYPV